MTTSMTLHTPHYITQFTLPPQSSSPMPSHLSHLASSLHTSLTTNTQVPRPSSPSFSPALPSPLTPTSAYTTAHHLTHLLHQSHGSTPIGRKIGFTNANIWTEYNVSGPNWGWVYDTSVFDLSSSPTVPKGQVGDDDGNPRVQEFDLSCINKLQPRIEPELVLGLNQKIERYNDFDGITDLELLSCVDWVAAGFEIVVSPYKDWKFSGVETTACGALHGRLLVGERVFLDRHQTQPSTSSQQEEESMLRCLSDFGVELHRNNALVERGVGRNVLGGPVRALRFLVKEVREFGGIGLMGGEIVTTGTLTGAWLVENGETWEMRVAGLQGVEGVKCRFAM